MLLLLLLLLLVCGAVVAVSFDGRRRTINEQSMSSYS